MFHRTSPLRIFAFSAVFTIAMVVLSIANLGWAVLPTLIFLLIIEITFSFENAVINARILTHMSRFWQIMFLTIGILIAIFGMRIVFPILIVAITTGLPWQTVLDLALNNPNEYSAALAKAYPSIAAFGASFLMMLALHFFFDAKRQVLWLPKIERPLKKLSYPWMPAIVTAGILGIISLIPMNSHKEATFSAGAIGIVSYVVIHGLTEFFGAMQTTKERKKGSASPALKTGVAGLMAFLYLELLDASFSLDSVIGAFAITNQVLLIAAGLGAGAVWVRSITIYMVRRGTLHSYRYLEHGAHYTVFILAMTLFTAELFHFPEAIAGLIGVVLITLSVITSPKQPKTH